MISMTLPTSMAGSRVALTSVPWPASREDWPVAVNVPSQTVPLFDPVLTPAKRRFLLLTQAKDHLPEFLQVQGGPAGSDGELEHFSHVTLHATRQNLVRSPGGYNYQENDAEIRLGKRSLRLRLGLRPNTVDSLSNPDTLSWWQWCGAECVWSGPLAEAWRIGGHLVPYSVDAPGQWTGSGTNFVSMGQSIARFCGNILHGDLFLIVWRCGLVQATAHYRAVYFHDFPKDIPAFPILGISGLNGAWQQQSLTNATPLGQADRIDLSPSSLMIDAEHPVQMASPAPGSIVLQPWCDLRVLALKDKANTLHYLPPNRADVMPAGVSRTFRFNLALDGAVSTVARYQVPAPLYRQAGDIASTHIGPATRMAQRSLDLIREHTQRGGFDTGRVWRYLRRDLRTGVPQDDAAEWDGDLAHALFTLAYQTQQSPAEDWPLYLQHAYHAADVAVCHGHWLGRLEGSTTLTGPLPKHRVCGAIAAYLETGDPYLLDMARALLGSYMANESALQPRGVIGRDAYPIVGLLMLWDYTAEPMYFSFARQTALRLLRSQMPDGGFSGQAGAGVFSGVSALPGPNGIHFGSGCLAPIALFEWLRRESQFPHDLHERLRHWTNLVLRLQQPDGHWHTAAGVPYTLTGSTMMFSLLEADRVLNEPRCLEAVQRFVHAMDAATDCVNGTHSFISALYAHTVEARWPAPALSMPGTNS